MPSNATYKEPLYWYINKRAVTTQSMNPEYAFRQCLLDDPPSSSADSLSLFLFSYKIRPFFSVLVVTKLVTILANSEYCLAVKRVARRLRVRQSSTRTL